MATNVTKEEIRKQLTIIFASAAKSASYFSNNEQYEGFCGWCGVMAPLSRLAFFKTFGEVVTIEAETGARADLENWRKEYQTSEWAAHKTEADRTFCIIHLGSGDTDGRHPERRITVHNKAEAEEFGEALKDCMAQGAVWFHTNITVRGDM